MILEQWWNDNKQRKPGERPTPDHIIHNASYVKLAGIEHGLRVGKPVSNYLSYGTTLSKWIIDRIAKRRQCLVIFVLN
jgi:hypothetical protein